jgi:hypothetical protein
MPWPTPQDYNEAIQSPALSFRDPGLKRGTLELSALGLPRPVTGNFASVYRVSCGQRDWAVRCFWREFADMQMRYAAISAHLRQTRLPYTVGFEYLPEGIKVLDRWFPILKMEWVEGQLLNEYVEQHLHDGAVLAALARRWSEMVARLEKAEIAHGDLQHGNVLIVDGEIRLVDYDGMRVPALAGALSHELGHRNYQHPGRGFQSFGPCLDRFSAWVIYLSLLALSEQPELWTELRGGDECLLLRQEDFVRPAKSHALVLLRRCDDPQLRALAGHFQCALDGDPVVLPSLGEHVFPPAARSLPDWVLSCVDDGLARTTEGFSKETRTARVGLVLLVGLCLVVWFARLIDSSLSPEMLSAATGGIAALTIILTALSYRRDPIVIRKRQLSRRRREPARKLSSIDRVRRRSVGALTRLTDRHDRGVHRLGQTRAWLQKVEQGKQDAVLAVYAEMTRSLGRAQAAIAEREERALARELRTLQGQYIAMKLRVPIRSARIEGVNWSLRLRLWMTGFRTAADVSQERAEGLRRFDRARLAPVLVWSATIRRQAHRSAPTSVPAPRYERVTRPYRRRQMWLDGECRTAGQRKQEICEAVACYYAARYAEIDAAVQALSERQLERYREIERRLADASRDEPFHHRQLVEAQRDLEPLRRFTFVRYVLFVVTGIQSRD